MGPFPASLLPPQSPSGWTLPKFNQPNLWGFYNLINDELLVPAPLPQRFPSQWSSSPSHQNKLRRWSERRAAAQGCKAARLHPTAVPMPSFTPPENPAQGFYCRIFDKVGSNYRATVNSRLWRQLPYSWPPSSQPAGAEGGGKMPHF